jgi:Rrf2 family nitric oxide-sensitive transcriptional repressor
MLWRSLTKSNILCRSFLTHIAAGEAGMRLTVYTDYALRLLMYLALKEDGCATISEVAQAYGISKSHLMKVAHQLGVAGYIGTVRGKGGGLRLGKAAQEIGLGEVVRYAEPDMALVPCFAPVNAFCPIVPSCVLRGALEEAREAFLRVLDAYTLADLVRPGSALRALLSIPTRGLDPCTDDGAASPPRRGRTRARSKVASSSSALSETP